MPNAFTDNTSVIGSTGNNCLSDDCSACFKRVMHEVSRGASRSYFVCDDCQLVGDSYVVMYDLRLAQNMAIITSMYI